MCLFHIGPVHADESHSYLKEYQDYVHSVQNLENRFHRFASKENLMTFTGK